MRSLPWYVHQFRLRTSLTYRSRHLEAKRVALGAVHGLPARYAVLPPLLTDSVRSLFTR